jgi:hypothetical protein
MSRRRKTRQDGGFYMVARLMTHSAAYQSLSPRAGWLLHGLMDRYQGTDNRVAMSRDEARALLKSGPHQAAVAFDELQAKGFIRCHERGGFSRKVAHATVWALTMFGRNGQKATLDFLSWQPGDGLAKNKTRVPRRYKCGYQGDTRGPATGTNAVPANDFHGYCGGTSAGTNAVPLIESTIQERVQVARLPKGTRQAGGMAACASGCRDHQSGRGRFGAGDQA